MDKETLERLKGILERRFRGANDYYYKIDAEADMVKKYYAMGVCEGLKKAIEVIESFEGTLECEKCGLVADEVAFSKVTFNGKETEMKLCEDCFVSWDEDWEGDE